MQPTAGRHDDELATRLRNSTAQGLTWDYLRLPEPWLNWAGKVGHSTLLLHGALRFRSPLYHSGPVRVAVDRNAVTDSSRARVERVAY